MALRVLALALAIVLEVVESELVPVPESVPPVPADTQPPQKSPNSHQAGVVPLGTFSRVLCGVGLWMSFRVGRTFLWLGRRGREEEGKRRGEGKRRRGKVLIW